VTSLKVKNTTKIERVPRGHSTRSGRLLDTRAECNPPVTDPESFSSEIVELRNQLEIQFTWYNEGDASRFIFKFQNFVIETSSLFATNRVQF
jgi:hypothetical protein